MPYVTESNIFSSQLNTELRAIIGRKKTNLRALEEKTGISRSKLSLVINQDKGSLNTNDLSKICQALGTSVRAVIKATEDSLTEKYPHGVPSYIED